VPHDLDRTVLCHGNLLKADGLSLSQKTIRGSLCAPPPSGFFEVAQPSPSLTRRHQTLTPGAMLFAVQRRTSPTKSSGSPP